MATTNEIAPGSTKKKKPFNPFYVLLVFVGLIFSVTACAFGVMTLRGMHAMATTEVSASGEQLMAWLDTHGFSLMMVELTLLAGLTIAAIATDEYWTKKSAREAAGRADVRH